MRKICFVLIVLLTSVLSSFGQTLEAHYDVKFTMNMQTGNNKTEAYNFDYEGYLYQSKSKTIYFQKPLYLAKYPTGKIIKVINDNYIVFPLWIDSLQRLELNDIDSLICWDRADGAGNEEKMCYKRHVDFGIREWKFFDEIKEINGLKCQHAKLYSYDNPAEVITDAWFCQDININFGPGGIRDLPGLVVEATNYYMNETYTLKSYKLNPILSDDIFWPKEFVTAKFVIQKPLRASAKKQKTTVDKRDEIMKQ